MRNKKMVVGTILLLFAISGLCNIISVSAEEVYIRPGYYYEYDFDVKSKDQLKIDIDSSGTINVYVMTELQVDDMVASGGLVTLSLKKWKDIVFLDVSYTILEDGMYYVVVFNNNPYSRTVDINIRVIRYITPLLIGGLAIGAIGVALIIILTVSRKKNKRKAKAQQLLQQQQQPLQGVKKPKAFYCTNCGVENIDITAAYCPKCGSKIIRY